MAIKAISQDIERNNFEVSMLHIGATKEMLSKDESGRYRNQRMEWMWEGWLKNATEREA